MVRRSKRWRGVRDDREQLELVEFQPGTIYKYYYTLEDSDPGIMMETNLATKEVSINRENIQLRNGEKCSLIVILDDIYKSNIYYFLRLVVQSYV